MYRAGNPPGSGLTLNIFAIPSPCNLDNRQGIGFVKSFPSHLHKLAYLWINCEDRGRRTAKCPNPSFVLRHRFEKIFPSEDICKLIHDCNTAVADPVGAQEFLFADTALKFDEIFADTTCVKSHIHFPVDWVLLRDATRTLIKAIELIRGQGLKHRMGDPKKFMRDMNKLCIEFALVPLCSSKNALKIPIFVNYKPGVAAPKPA
jgi:hypothetical protein